MRITAGISDEEIDKGFTATGDIFRKKDLADRLTAMFIGLEHGSVCILDGRWGIGKSVFARQWIAELKLNNIPAIYFDAFASDYMESPFEAVAGALVKAAIEAGRSKDPKYKQFLSQASKVGRAVASTAAKIGVKAATLGVVGAAEIKQLDELKDEISDSLGELSEKHVAKLLESHADNQKNFSALRHSIEKLPELLRPSTVTSEEKHPPLIVIVDELDRCRPDFALGILEALKHFFRADGVHFVLVTNKQHLELSVANRYGISDAAQEYLEKFFDFSIFFEQSYDRHNDNNVGRYVATILGQLISSGVDQRDIHSYIQAISRAYRLSLRQISALATNIAISYLAARAKEFRPTALISFLALLKSYKPDLYKLAKQGLLTPGDFSNFLDSGRWDGEFNLDRIKTVFEFYLSKEIAQNDPRFEGYGREIWDYNLDRERVIPFLTEGILDRFGAPVK